ncbi:ABC transporter ATP-binding protein [Candidatus Pyrohabitans sp.]
MKVAIKIDNVTKKFGDFTCLESINLEIFKGEIHTLLGPSGCGKTTLLRMIAGLESPTEGKILNNTQVITGPSASRGFIFQHGAAFPWRTVLKNIEFGLELKGIDKEKRREICRKYIKLVGLEGFENYYPHQISGGMRQKMVLATVLANGPEIILMDEPFGALDAQTRSYMQRELLRIWEETQKTVVFVTHSIREAMVISSRVSVFGTRPGRILHTYDLNRRIGSQKHRDLSEERASRLEYELYTKLQPFMGHENGEAG